MYRSDIGPADTAPVQVTLPAVVPARPAVVPAHPAVVTGLPAVVPPRPTHRRAEPPQQTERGWIEAGLYVMTLPLTLTVRIMLMPVDWIFGERPRS